MKKLFRYYAVSWVVLWLAYNVIVLVVRGNVDSFGQNGEVFWITFSIVNLSFLGQLVSVWHVFQKGIGEMFTRLPLAFVSYSALVLTTIVSTVIMSIPSMAPWIAIIVSVLLFAMELLSVVRALASAAVAEHTAAKVHEASTFVKGMTAKAMFVLQNAQGEEERQIAQKVYDTFRYSDPVSSEKTASLEQEVEQAFAVFKTDPGKIQGEKVIALMRERNEMCKLGKGQA